MTLEDELLACAASSFLHHRNTGDNPATNCLFSPLRHRSVVRKKVLAAEERNCDWALTWWALADIVEPATPKGEFRMSYNTKQAIYYGEVHVDKLLSRNRRELQPVFRQDDFNRYLVLLVSPL